MAKVILSLASNRFQAKNLSRARQCLEEIRSDLRYSREHWTEPVGNAKRRDAYLNQLATGTTTLDEETLNERLKQMELSFGRTQAKRLLGIVPIDLDILQYDDERRHLLDWQRPYVTELIGDLFNSPPESGGARGGLNTLTQSENRFFRPPLTPPNLGGENGRKGLNTSYISKRHNQQEQTLLRKTLRNNATAPEALLWMKLKGKQIDGLKFRRQFGVGPYVIDFYCPELRLGIELDGDIHNRFDTEMHDNIRTAFLRENRIMLLRYKNEVVYQNVDAIVEDIRQLYRNTLNQVSPN